MNINQDNFKRVLKDSLESIGLKGDEKLIWRLEYFAKLLKEWNSIHNLTGNDSFEALIENIIDSIYPVSFLSKPSSLLDVGTGAGFPGLILASIWFDTPTILCEPLNKRASFLRYASFELKLNNVTVVRKRVEKLEHKPFALISSRAVTDTKMLLNLTKNVSNKDTHYLFYKGSRVIEEIEQLEDNLESKIIKRGARQYLLLTPIKKMI